MRHLPAIIQKPSDVRRLPFQLEEMSRPHNRLSSSSASETVFSGLTHNKDLSVFWNVV